MPETAIRVLLLSKYGDLGASSRMRALQFLPYLKAAGIRVDVSTLLDNSYVQAFHNGKLALGSIISGYARRVVSLLRQRTYDLIWVEKEFLPWLPKVMETLLLGSGMPYVVDYDDAVFHRYDMHENALIRKFLGTRIDLTMRNACVVVAGNEYLAQRATLAGAVRVEILPTVVDISRYSKSIGATGVPFCVGWIGQSSTVQYLKMIEAPMRALYAEKPVTLRVVGPANWFSSSCPFQLRVWSEVSESSEIDLMDVGVMPLRDDLWERGKCGYKLIQYMAAGKPVVASPVGVNRQIVDHGVTGFLARTEDEWLRALRELRENPVLRKKMGDAGRQNVEQKYSLQVAAPRLAGILRSAVSARQ